MDKVKILIVDDEKEICEITKNFLAKRDYMVFTATAAEEAVNVARKEQPHLMLLDVRLGSDSGLDVLGKIKAIDKNIRVIMVTALDDEATIRQAKSLGADDYIAKPFTAAYLNDFLLQKISNLGLRQHQIDK